MRVRVMRQVHFSTADQRSIDLVFFVNGLPVATVELKTDFTQSLDEAIEQYRKNRHPLTNGRPEPLLSFGHRALVHFAVSNDLVCDDHQARRARRRTSCRSTWATTGRGQPARSRRASATAYLWERVLGSSDAWLNILGRLMHRGDQGGVGRRHRQRRCGDEHAVPAVPPVGGRHRTSSAAVTEEGAGTGT